MNCSSCDGQAKEIKKDLLEKYLDGDVPLEVPKKKSRKRKSNVDKVQEPQTIPRKNRKRKLEDTNEDVEEVPKEKSRKHKSNEDKEKGQEPQTKPRNKKRKLETKEDTEEQTPPKKRSPNTIQGK